MFARVTECILQILIMEYIIDCVRVDARWNVPMFMVSFCPVASGFSTESKYTHTKSHQRRLNSLFHWFHPYSLLSERNISFIHIYIVFINVYGVFYVIISLFLYRWQHHARSSLESPVVITKSGPFCEQRQRYRHLSVHFTSLAGAVVRNSKPDPYTQWWKRADEALNNNSSSSNSSDGTIK